MKKRVSAYKVLTELCEEAIYIHQLPNVDDVIKYIATVSDFKHLDKREINKIMNKVMLNYAPERQ